MEDYTKFRLKSRDEIVPLLEGKDNLFVVACNKCFKEFENADEPERGEFEKIAAEQGKKITGCVNVDFLCNKTTTQNKLELPTGTENVAVISCGLGIQTVADLSDMPVYAAADSVKSYDGHHGMALTTVRCDGCGQCYLNLTGGICPIVDCSKSLVNGQCGGSKNFKCEVSKDKDCAWDKIHERLAAQGRAAEILNVPVQLRDHSKVNFKFIDDYVKSIREKRFEGYYGGIHPSEYKELAEFFPLKTFPAPDNVVIPLSQHAGAPAQAIVAAGDTVKTGQKIGEAGGFISSTIHSSVSGTVTAVEERLHPTTGVQVMSVVIKSDGKDELHESVKPVQNWESLSVDEIADIVREKGIVGMGGAGFPTAVKLKSPKPIDTVLLNGCECEPLLTCDHRVMLEFADDVIFGLKVLIKTTGAEKGMIVIEDNKHDAIELLEKKTADIPNIGIVVAKTKYPQGAEKMLIKRALGKSVPSGALPLDVGVVVSNVSTVKAVSDAIQKGMPLIERAVTVTGPYIKNPGNYMVKVGTPVQSLIDHCGGLTSDDVTIKLGGPMMGFEIENFDVPMIKGTNGIIAIEPDVSEASDCIKCGRCADVCPMELLPLYYPKLAMAQDWTGANDKSVRDCMECGCCEFICSSKIPLRYSIKQCKKGVIEQAQKEGK
ncbi:MAG: electron transport complex subunit RsxC [Oscillospiraceae bacterium]|nr:electron transport complex subunit RsxC [Oscillospiraceae bacterium]